MCARKYFSLSVHNNDDKSLGVFINYNIGFKMVLSPTVALPESIRFAYLILPTFCPPQRTLIGFLSLHTHFDASIYHMPTTKLQGFDCGLDFNEFQLF